MITTQDVYFEIEGLWYNDIYCKGWIKFTQYNVCFITSYTLKTNNEVSNFIFKYEISPNRAHQGHLEKRLQYHRVKNKVTVSSVTSAYF